MIEELNKENFSSQLAEKIWGHRFTDGQRGPEYVLEFLNVMYGTDYQLNADSYRRIKSIGLRKFIFEGTKEGSKNGIVELELEKKQALISLFYNPEDINVIRNFLRNIEIPIYNANGKPADRSWYAKTLYPLHEILLFFELRNNKGTISFERNFFARGGELYYLMISNGTKENIETKEFIEERLKELLQKNESIYRLVSCIKQVVDTEESQQNNSNDALLKRKEGVNKEYPILPESNLEIYTKFANELKQILSIDIDIYEMFQLLVSLICFQLMRYMHNRANDNNEKLQYFFDCLDGTNQHLRALSSKTFMSHESMVKEKFNTTFDDIYMKKIQSIDIEKKLEEWKSEKKSEAIEFLALLGLSRLSKGNREKISKSLYRCNSLEDIKTKLHKMVKEIVIDQAKKHQLNILRILARDGGIGNFRVGTNYRYTMSDVFLQVLVFTVVKPSESIEFSQFLQKIYHDYGFVIGEREAKESGLYTKSSLNIRYFQKNENALREKLKQNGLLIEFSDATAMIRNPYKIARSNEVLV